MIQSKLRDVHTLMTRSKADHANTLNVVPCVGNIKVDNFQI